MPTNLRTRVAVQKFPGTLRNSATGGTLQRYPRLNHPVAPVYLNGEVVEGVGLPESVALTPVPGTDYGYAYVNNLPVLVEPSTRQVEYIYR